MPLESEFCVMLWSFAGLASFDWSLLDPINESIAKEENVLDDKLDTIEQAGFTLVCFCFVYILRSFLRSIFTLVQLSNVF